MWKVKDPILHVSVKMILVMEMTWLILISLTSFSGHLYCLKIPVCSQTFLFDNFIEILSFKPTLPWRAAHDSAMLIDKIVSVSSMTKIKWVGESHVRGVVLITNISAFQWSQNKFHCAQQTIDTGCTVLVKNPDLFTLQWELVYPSFIVTEVSKHTLLTVVFLPPLRVIHTPKNTANWDIT